MFGSLGLLAVIFAWMFDFQIWNVFEAKMTAKCPMDPKIRKLSSRHPCGHFVASWHTGLILAKSWKAKVYGSVLRFGPHTSDRPKKFTNRRSLMEGSRKTIAVHLYIVLVIPLSCTSSKTDVFVFSPLFEICGVFIKYAFRGAIQELTSY